MNIINSSGRNVGATRCHSRERANAVRPFADGHARSARSIGATRSRRRCVRVARLVSSRPMGPTGGCLDSRAFFLLTCGDSRSGPRTLAHRLPPLEPQASKRHDVPDLRRRATREQRGRPEHPRVEPPGASSARHLTHVHARVRRNAAADFVAFRCLRPHTGLGFFVENLAKKTSPCSFFFRRAPPPRRPPSFARLVLTFSPLFAIPRVRLRRTSPASATSARTKRRRSTETSAKKRAPRRSTRRSRR